jgi:AcrR family transcriptional regulator
MVNPNSHPKGEVRPLRTRLREVTKQAILEAAEDTFSDQGIHAARMEDIAALAGTAVGTLYNYFSDRQALLDALVATRREELLAKVEAAIESTKRLPFEQRLARFFESVVGHVEAHRRLFAILLDEDGRACARKQSVIQEVVDRAAVLVEQGVRSGDLRKQDSDLFPTLLMGTVKGVFARASHRSEPVPSDVVAPLVRFFLRGAGADST